MSERSIDDDLQLALRLADEADRIGMRYFTGEPLVHDIKEDGSPVTAADREIEERLLSLVASERPGDGFLGEEVGEHPGDGEAGGVGRRRWIVDGIDGTIVFVAGDDGWGTQIALQVGERMIVGVSTSPAMGRRWWASRGGGAWTGARAAGDGSGSPVRLRVSVRADPVGATCSSIPPVEVLDAADAVLARQLMARCAYLPPREHAALMVAEGRIDAALQLGGGPWDFAALALIVEEAGGRFSDRHGAWDIEGGGPVLYTNGEVHAEMLSLLRGADDPRR